MKFLSTWKATLAFLLVFLAGCAPTTLIRNGMPEVYDYRRFVSDKIAKPETPFQFAKSDNIALPPCNLWVVNKEQPGAESPEKFLASNHTLGFLVIKNDTILYENYFNGHDRDSISQVFSVTKTFISTLVGIAVSEGKMCVDEPVSDFLPYFRWGKKSRITINHLLQMTSGLKFADERTPGKLVQLYYSKDQEMMLRNAKVQYEPGTHFAYCSMNTQILGMCLEKAVDMTVAQYMEEKIWKPLGMEHDAQIALEKEGGEAKMFSGLAATCRDLAKLGRLFLNNGNWNGKQIIPEDWVLACRKRNTTDGSSPTYTNCWWLDTYGGVKSAKDKDDFFAGGYRGQFIYVNPDDSVIIVRVGTKEPGANWSASISKLGDLPFDGKTGLTGKQTGSLNGSYKDKKGKQIKVTFDEGKAVISNYGTISNLEFDAENSYGYVNHKRKMKLIFNYRNNQVVGLLLESGNQSSYYSKL